MTRDELKGLALALATSRAPEDAEARLIDGLSPSNDPLVRAWAAILWGGLVDGGHVPVDDRGTTQAIPLLMEIARGKLDQLEELDEWCDEDPIYDETTGLAGARNHALAGLSGLGPLAAEAAPALIEILESWGDADGVRVLAAEALGSMAASERGEARLTDPRIVEALTRAVDAYNDNEGTIRESVMEALRRIGRPARAAIPALEAALADRENKFLFEAISETLAELKAS
jgi:hypothetical protein